VLESGTLVVPSRLLFGGFVAADSARGGRRVDARRRL